MNSQTVINKLNKLSQSKFRNSFQLKKKDVEYVNKLGISKIREHAYDLIRKRVAPENPKNDGAQTPMNHHPVFIAQHATATCCRTCLYKWHNIKLNKVLTEHEIDYIVALIMTWIEFQIKKHQ